MSMKDMMAFEPARILVLLENCIYCYRQEEKLIRRPSSPSTPVTRGSPAERRHIYVCVCVEG